MYLVTMIPLVCLFALQHYCSTFTNISIICTQAFSIIIINLTHKVSYRTHGRHVVIYIPVFALYV